MKRSLSLIASASLMLLAASCVQTTPTSRIENSPGAFERLSEEEKELVQKGQLAPGMDREAVTLAWGDPANRVDMFRGGKRIERWDYRGLEPIVTNSFYGGYSSSLYRRSRYRGYSSFGTSVDYVPVRRASVLFFNGKVTEWERSR